MCTLTQNHMHFHTHTQHFVHECLYTNLQETKINPQKEMKGKSEFTYLTEHGDSNYQGFWVY